MRKRSISGLLVVMVILVTACGGDNGGPPVDMEKEETSAFTLDRPKDWKVDSMDMLGITMLVASSRETSAGSLLSSIDPAEMFKDAAGVLIMAVPQEMAEEGGDFGFSADEIRDIAADEPDVEIIRQGAVTVDGVKGYELVGKGEIEELGSGKMGVHIAVLERESGPLAFIGFSPEEDGDKNLDIFKHMFESIRFR